MQDRRLWMLVAGVGALMALGGLVAGLVLALDGGDDDAAGGRFGTVTTAHLAPTGELIVADAGTGNDDGRVLALTIDLVAAVPSGGDLPVLGTRVLMEGLPSRRVGGGLFGEIAGPVAADLDANGTVCVVIGGVGVAEPGFASLRCSDGRTIDLWMIEALNDPDGAGVLSDPFDVASDGAGGWLVSDRGANTVIHAAADGSLAIVGVLSPIPSAGGEVAAQPLGLFVLVNARGQSLVAVAAYGGGIVGLAPGSPAEPYLNRIDGHPVAIVDDGAATYTLRHADASGANRTGAIEDSTRRIAVDGLDRPTGLARLDDGRFVVVERHSGRIRVYEPREVSSG